MAKRILSIAMALLLLLNVFAVAASAEASEADYHAAFKLTTDTAIPKRGDTITVTLSAQTDYPVAIVGAVMAYDTNYYSIVGLDSGAFTVKGDYPVDVLGTAKATTPSGMYHSSYTPEMKAQYGLAAVSLVWVSSKAVNGEYTPTDTLTDMTELVTFQFTVKDDAPEDGKGLIWMDPVYEKTATSRLRNTTRVARGGETLAEGSVADYGQTLDFSEAVLYQGTSECEHASSQWVTTTEATCTTAGSKNLVCDECGAVLDTQEIAALGHTWGDWVVTKDPTTTETGLKERTCSVCKETEKETIPVLTECEHASSQWVTTTEATCTTAGSKDLVCDECGAVLDTQEITALGHDFGDWTVTKAATCTAEGEEQRDCSRCDETETRAIEKIAHTPGEWTVEKAATCKEEGQQVKRCVECNEIVDTAIIAKTPHTWGDWVVEKEATETETGLKARTCAVCSEREEEIIPVLAGKADYTAVDAAIAAIPRDLSVFRADGVEALNEAVAAVVRDLPASEQDTVDAYAQAISDAIDNLIVISSKLGNYDDLNNLIDKFVPSESNKTSGIYDADEIAALETLIDGFDMQLGQSYQDEIDGYTAALRDALSNLTVDESKAIAGFNITTDVATAGEYDIVKVSVKLKTNYPIYTMMIPVIYDGTIFEMQNATATVKDFATFEGSLADAYSTNANWKISSTILSAGNSNTDLWGSAESLAKYKVAYMTWTADSKLSTTGVTLDEEETIVTFELMALDGIPTDTQTDIFMNADFIKTAAFAGGKLAVGRAVGNTLSTLTGAHVDVGQTIDLSNAKATVTINPSCVHDYQAVVTAPTCTEQGYTTYTCSKCQDSYVADYVDALGHDYGEWTVKTEATCTEAGVEERTCSRCPETEERAIEALGHDAGEWTVKTAATCTEAGVEELICTRCKTEVLDTRAIDALGHDYGEWTVKTEATCTEAGVEERTCSRCPETEERAIEALGHDAGEWTVKTAATCTEAGVEELICTRCKTEVLDTRAIDALGHDYGEWTVKTEATCTEAGVEERTCSRCPETEERAIEALGHDAGEWIVKTAATCTEAGVEELICTRCKTEVLDTREIAALGHDYQAVVTAPTCTEQGYTTYTCSRCKDSYVADYVEALGHNWGEWVVVKEPTTTETGLKERTCAACGEKETEIIPVLTECQHVAGDWEVTQNATCTEDGTQVRRCTICGEIIDTAVIPALGHDYGEWVSDGNACFFTNGTHTKTCKVCGDKVTEIEQGSAGYFAFIECHCWFVNIWIYIARIIVIATTILFKNIKWFL